MLTFCNGNKIVNGFPLLTRAFKITFQNDITWNFIWNIWTDIQNQLFIFWKQIWNYISLPLKLKKFNLKILTQIFTLQLISRLNKLLLVCQLNLIFWQILILYTELNINFLSYLYLLKILKFNYFWFIQVVCIIIKLNRCDFSKLLSVPCYHKNCTIWV